MENNSSETNIFIDEDNGRQLRESVRGEHDPQTLGYVVQVHCPGERADEMTVVDYAYGIDRVKRDRAVAAAYQRMNLKPSRRFRLVFHMR